MHQWKEDGVHWAAGDGEGIDPLSPLPGFAPWRAALQGQHGCG